MVSITEMASGLASGEFTMQCVGSGYRLDYHYYFPILYCSTWQLTDEATELFIMAIESYIINELIISRN